MTTTTTTTTGGSSSHSYSKAMIMSTTLFVTISYYWLMKQQQQQQQRRKKQSPQGQLDDDNDRNQGRQGRIIHHHHSQDDDHDDIPIEVMNGSISQRGSDMATGRLYQMYQSKKNDDSSNSNSGDAMAYIQQFFYAIKYMHHVIDEPMGYIPLCVAENKLITDLIMERMNQPGTIEHAFHESPLYHYAPFHGIPMARDAISYFLTRYFYRMPSHDNKETAGTSSSVTNDASNKATSSSLFPMIHIEDALQTIKPDHIKIGPGASSLLNHLFYTLGEENDCCLLPTPYYAAFENDMITYGHITPFPITNIMDRYYGPTVDEYEMAYQQAIDAGYRVRFVLLCNPHNPLGIIYPTSAIINMIDWCRSKKSKIHMIFDEIYALSTHAIPGQHTFRSIIQIVDNQFGDDIHMIYALSKDFGMSGMRYGILYSQNIYVMKALQGSIGILHSINGPLQYMLSEIMTDDVFVEHLLQTSRQRILYNYHICIEKCQEMVIPYITPSAGIFLYINLSSLLPMRTIEYERQLTQFIFHIGRIVLTPGESQRDPTPGMYRICYAWVSSDVLQIAMERLSRLVAMIRRMDWEDLQRCCDEHAHDDPPLQNIEQMNRIMRTVLYEKDKASSSYES